jgi:hypothetical protein
MFANKMFTVFIALSGMLIVYLFATAPAPLPGQNGKRSEAQVRVAQLLEICAAENDVVRKLYTKEIVGKGKEAGLSFDEKWRERGVDAGPLPALFLRETAKSLEKNPVRLGLFLGSDFPISQANLFEGRQARMFQQMRRDKQPRHFFVEDLSLYTAMFPDLAVAPACVSCHNEHPNTKKKDWKLGDVMGATTWTFPRASLSVNETLEVLAALRQGFRDAYTAYVEKSQTFQRPPIIGNEWPKGGYHLPTPEVFMKEVERRASPTSMRQLLAIR